MERGPAGARGNATCPGFVATEAGGAAGPRSSEPAGAARGSTASARVTGPNLHAGSTRRGARGAEAGYQGPATGGSFLSFGCRGSVRRVERRRSASGSEACDGAAIEGCGRRRNRRNDAEATDHPAGIGIGRDVGRVRDPEAADDTAPNRGVGRGWRVGGRVIRRVDRVAIVLTLA